MPSPSPETAAAQRVISPEDHHIARKSIDAYNEEEGFHAWIFTAAGRRG